LPSRSASFFPARHLPWLPQHNEALANLEFTTRNSHPFNRLRTRKVSAQINPPGTHTDEFLPERTWPRIRSQGRAKFHTHTEERRMGLFTKDIKSMDNLFTHTLQDIYY